MTLRLLRSRPNFKEQMKKQAVWPAFLFLRIAAIDRFDPLRRLNKSAAKLIILCRKPGLLYLVERFLLFHRILNYLRRVCDRIAIRLQIGCRCKRPVARDQFRIGRDRLEQGRNIIYQAGTSG